jgi:hypothetical protein
MYVDKKGLAIPFPLDYDRQCLLILYMLVTMHVVRLMEHLG